MGLETASVISDLVTTNPLASDPRNEGDDHIRMLKAVVKADAVSKAALHASTEKSVPVDGDELMVADSAAGFAPVRTLFSSIKAVLKTYFDTLYVGLTGSQTIAGTKTFSSTIAGNISGSSTSCTGNAATATYATSSATATYATSAGTAVDATARATADAAAPRDCGVLGVGAIVYAQLKSGYVASGSTTTGGNLYLAYDYGGSWNLTDMSTGTWRNISPLMAEAGINSLPFQRIA